MVTWEKMKAIILNKPETTNMLSQGLAKVYLLQIYIINEYNRDLMTSTM